jgi:hypothetical protein
MTELLGKWWSVASGRWSVLVSSPTTDHWPPTTFPVSGRLSRHERLIRKTIISLTILAILFQINGCKRVGVFSSIGSTTEIVVEDVFASNKEIKKITDPATISQIVAFVNSQEKGWKSPWYDPPIPKVRVIFYAHQRKLGTLSIGADFFSTGSYLKPASEQEVRRIFELIGLDKNQFIER